MDFSDSLYVPPLLPPFYMCMCVRVCVSVSVCVCVSLSHNYRHDDRRTHARTLRLYRENYRAPLTENLTRLAADSLTSPWASSWFWAAYRNSSRPSACEFLINPPPPGFKATTAHHGKPPSKGKTVKGRKEKQK